MDQDIIDQLDFLERAIQLAKVRLEHDQEARERIQAIFVCPPHLFLDCELMATIAHSFSIMIPPIKAESLGIDFDELRLAAKQLNRSYERIRISADDLKFTLSEPQRVFKQKQAFGKNGRNSALNRVIGKPAYTTSRK